MSPVAATFSLSPLRRGHTLVELVAATGVAVLLAGLTLQLAAGILLPWTRAQARMEAQAEIETVLEQIARDLEGAIFRDDGAVWMAASVLPDRNHSGSWEAAPGTGKPGNEDPRTLNLGAERIGDCRFGEAGVWLRFFTTRMSDNSTVARLSNPAAVGYQIVRRRPVAGSAAPPRYLLFRSQVTATNSWEAGFDLDPDNPGSGSQSYTRANGTDGHAGSLIRPNLGNLAAMDVIDFGVRFLRRTEEGVWEVLFPTVASGPEYLVRPAAPAPQAAEILLRRLTPEGVRRIRRLEEEGGGADWWSIAEAHSLVVTRRVRFATEPVSAP